jgi:hypothetical protein
MRSNEEQSTGKNRETIRRKEASRLRSSQADAIEAAANIYFFS